MINCDACDTQQLPGTLFCDECGHFLGDVQGWTPQSMPLIKHIRFLIAASGRKLSLDLAKPIWIGRTDTEANFWPRLDLTPDGAVEQGVSRQHAMIKQTPEGIVLVDKNSANGTWLNNVRLAVERPYPLPSKSEVHFGKLLVHIFLE